MKQTASILLLALLGFNWIGYRLVSVYFENQSDRAIENRIEQSAYDDSQLIEIRVPLNAPYYSGNTAEFETFHGELELSGVHYNYVKRKIVNGELVLLCLPNQEKTRLQNSRADFFQLVNDLNRSTPQGKDKSPASSVKSFSGDYTQENNFPSISDLAFSNPVHINRNVSFHAIGYNNIPKQPPRI